MGFKVIETEEELRSAFTAGLMWWKADDDTQFYREDTGFGVNVTLRAWRARVYEDGSGPSWEAYVLVEDDDD